MRFFIDRASEERKNSPCKGAIKCKKMNSVQIWSIGINTLEELMALVEKEDRLIIEKREKVGDFHKISIYDDYVE